MTVRERHISSGETYLFCGVEAKVKWRGREGERQRDKWVRRDTEAEQVMEERSQKATETESEGESDCRWVVDRWASGQVRQVDSGKPVSLLAPLPHPPTLPSTSAGDCRCGIAYRAEETGLHQKKPPNSLQSCDNHLTLSATRQQAWRLTRQTDKTTNNNEPQQPSYASKEKEKKKKNKEWKEGGMNKWITVRSIWLMGQWVFQELLLRGSMSLWVTWTEDSAADSVKSAAAREERTSSDK